MGEPRICMNCGSAVLAVKRATKYCSIRCAKLHHYATTSPDPRAVITARCVIDPRTKCWNWTGDTAGAPVGGLRYGRAHYRGKSWRAHRLSFAAFTGPIPDKLWVLHECDNPLCVNPAHLFLGDAVINAADMHQKGRHPHSTRHGMAKLSTERCSVYPGASR